MTSGIVLWLSGLSGAGKSTVSNRAAALLTAHGLRVRIIDGDDIRRDHTRHLGFTEPDIRENNALIAALCAESRTEHDVIIVPIISPFAAHRTAARQQLSPGFFEVYVKADVETVTLRDTKGLYAKEKRGEITNLIGVSDGAPYEPPASPDLVINTTSEGPEASGDALASFALAWLNNA